MREDDRFYVDFGLLSELPKLLMLLAHIAGVSSSPEVNWFIYFFSLFRFLLR
jgi:hypothetical protein